MEETLETFEVTIVPKSTRNVDSRKIVASRPVVIALTVTILFCTSLNIWLSFDKHVPLCDEASHVLNALTYSDLLHHARPFRADWWHKFFTVNTYYPPVGTLTMGISLALIKDQILALQLVKIWWLAVLSLAVGTIAFIASRSRIALAGAICLVNLCVVTCDYSHSSMLDLPLMAMVAVGLASIYWKNGRASIKHSVTTGIILGLAIMTKQVAIAFLGIPLLLDSLLTIKQNHYRASLLSLGLTSLPILAICLPWTALNFSAMQHVNSDIAAALSKRGSASSRMLFNLEYYMGSWLFCASPLVLIGALVGFVSLRRDQHKTIIPMWLSVLPAALALCLIDCQPARDRYIAPIVLLIAIVGGVGLAAMWERNKKLFFLFLTIFLPLATAQFISFNFSPYPIAENISLAKSSEFLACQMRDHVSPFFDKTNSLVSWKHLAPSSKGAELATQILDCIEAEDGKQTSWLNITASTGGVDVHEIELLARLRGLATQPSTTRTWTALGDEEVFSESKILNHKWYVIKAGEQGFRFADKKSQAAHEQITSFIKANYILVKTLVATDGSEVGLYRTRQGSEVRPVMRK